MLGLLSTLYYFICIFVQFIFETQILFGTFGILDIPESHAFIKYSTCWIFLAI